MVKKSTSSKKVATKKKTTAKKSSMKKKAVSKKVSKKSATKKKVSSSKVASLRVELDIGFGNSLFIRGEGTGLSWNKGTLLNCQEDALWTWTSKTLKTPAEFKILINDEIWSTGENYKIKPGQDLSITPKF